MTARVSLEGEEGLRKILAFGDVHADQTLLWSALKAGYACDRTGRPTPPVLDGRYLIVLMGDLVHPKNLLAYEALTGFSPFDILNQEHLAAASTVQAAQVLRVKEYQARGNGHVYVLQGNHDKAAADQSFVLGTAGGLVHSEFDPGRGGLALPEDLSGWVLSLPTSVDIDGVQFAHAGPTPGMNSFDDFFYSDPDVKTWWHAKPWLVKDCGYRFGVYGHTVMARGVYLDLVNALAMVDALDDRQFLELFVHDDGRIDPRIARF